MVLRTNVVPGDPAHAKLHNDVNAVVNAAGDVTAARDQAVAAAAQAVDISNISTPDSLIASRVNDPASATAAALVTKITSVLGTVVVARPNGFPLPARTYSVRRAGAPRTFTTDYDINNDRPPTGATYYASPVGTSGAAGTQGSPTSLRGAHDKTDVGTIMLLPGEYFRDQGFDLIGKSLNIIATGPGVLLTQWTNPASITWTLHTGNIYKITTATGEPAQVVLDRRAAYLTPNGDNATYLKVANLAAVTAAGRWAQVGTTLYVWALNNANLVSDSSFMRVSQEGVFRGIIVNAAVRVYCEGFEIQGCGWASAAVPSVGAWSSGDGSTFLFKTVRIRYGPLAGFVPRGALWSAAIGCRVSCCVGDGFGYQSAGGNLTEFLELDCQAYDLTGYDTDNTINAFTSHDDCNGVRINGIGHHTRGPIYADVSGTNVWNLGCVALTSTATVLQQKVGFQTFDGSEGWFDSCFADGVEQGISAYNAPVNLRDNTFGSAATNGVYVIGSGTVSTY